MAKKHSEDIFVRIIKSIEGFLINYRKVLIIGVSACIVLLAGYLTADSIMDRRRNLSEDSFGQVYLVYRAVLEDGDRVVETENDRVADEELLAVAESFKVVIEEHGSTLAAAKSGFYIGSIFYDAGTYEEAAEYFRKGYEQGSRFYTAPLCLAGEAGCFEQLERFEEAEAVYRSILADFEDSYLIPTVRYSLGQLYEKMDNTDGARKQYESIMEDYEWSTWAQLSEKRVLLLGSST